MRLIPHSRPKVHPEAIRRVHHLLSRGLLSHGREVERLEQTVSAAYEGSAACAVSSGSAALYLALRALGVCRGQEVLIPSWTCNSVRAAVELTGARAVPVDAAPNGLTLSVAHAKALRTPQTGAVVAVHQFGFEADVEGLLALGVPVIEDCAHAPASRGRDGALLGLRGHAAILSFYATKLVPGAEGGMVISRDRETVDAVFRMRNCDTDDAVDGAFNFKMSDIHASLAHVHFSMLAHDIARRETLARRYDRCLGSWAVRCNPAFTEYPACPFRYLLAIEQDIGGVAAAARAKGVMCARPIRTPLHRLLGGKCPRAEWLQSRLLSIPCYPVLTDSEAAEVCSILATILSA